MMKMLVTIGPSSEASKDITAISRQSNLYRLNGSHGTLEWHSDVVARIRKIDPAAFVLMDIPGIKPRTSNVQSVEVEQNQIVSFGELQTPKAEIHIGLTKPIPTLSDDVSTFSVNDGQFQFDVVESSQSGVSGRSRASFTLLPKKGFNIPSSIYREELQKDIYLNFIESVSHLDINGVGLSFVQTGKLVSDIRAAAPSLVLVSKIENSEGLRNREEIIVASDAVMIDRGDLAAEIGLFNLFEAVEAISYESKVNGKPLIMATENLETMTIRLEPSKSEVMSLGHSESLAADCIMLSEETAVSDNFENTISWLGSYLNKVEAPRYQKVLAKPKHGAFPELWNSVQNLDDIPIILFTRSGYALSEMMSACLNRRLVVVTDNLKVQSVAKLYRQNIIVIDEVIKDAVPSEFVYKIVSENVGRVFGSDQLIVAVYVSKQFRGARANNLTFLSKTMFEQN